MRASPGSRPGGGELGDASSHMSSQYSVAVAYSLPVDDGGLVPLALGRSGYVVRVDCTLMVQPYTGAVANATQEARAVQSPESFEDLAGPTEPLVWGRVLGEAESPTCPSAWGRGARRRQFTHVHTSSHWSATAAHATQEARTVRLSRPPARKSACIDVLRASRLEFLISSAACWVRYATMQPRRSTDR